MDLLIFLAILFILFDILNYGVPIHHHEKQLIELKKELDLLTQDYCDLGRRLYFLEIFEEDMAYLKQFPKDTLELKKQYLKLYKRVLALEKENKK